MDIQNAASMIKDTVDMKTVLGLYGYQAKHGKMVCPFHNDKNASLKIYESSGRHSGWHCFGCGKGGSVIDFVMEHEGCDFVTAVKAIDAAMGLQLLDTMNLFEMKQRKSEQDKYDQIRELFDAYYDEAYNVLETMFRVDFEILQAIEEKPAEKRTADEWTLLSTIPEDLKYIEHLQDETQENKRKVMAWRNRARRVK